MGAYFRTYRHSRFPSRFRTQSMVAVAVRVLLFAYCSHAVQKFDIRTKIDVDGKPKIDSSIDTEIEDELRRLFCVEELKPEKSGNCDVVVLETDLSEKESEENVRKYIGEVKFKVSLEMPDGTSK